MEFSDRIVGSIVGGAIGDAIGGPYEGRAGPVEINRAAPWVLSDDTQLTLATCEAIIQAGSVIPQRVASRFLAWFQEGRLTGLGASTFSALRALSMGAHWSQAGRQGEYAAGNGAAMRAAPLAFVLDPQQPVDLVLIRDIAYITHRNEEAYAGALAVIIAIRAVCSRIYTPQANLPALVAAALPDSVVRDRLDAIAQVASSTHPMEIASKYGASGYVADSVPLAIYAAQRVGLFGLPHTLESAVQCGGDTDTIASITGQIAGAYVGISGVPVELVERLPASSDVIATARSFAREVSRKDRGR